MQVARVSSSFRQGITTESSIGDSARRGRTSARAASARLASGRAGSAPLGSASDRETWAKSVLLIWTVKIWTVKNSNQLLWKECKRGGGGQSSGIAEAGDGVRLSWQRLLAGRRCWWWARS